MKKLKKRAILLLVSFVVFLIAAVAFTYGWYTKMVAVTAVEFEAAQWEFNASTQLDTIYVNVFRYYQVNPNSGEEEFGKLAAPGTQGFIPINLSAESSDTDVRYELIIDKSSMSNEFQQRIHFYRDPECTQEMFSNDEDSALTGSIPYGTMDMVRIYWKWVYEMTEVDPSASVEDQIAWDEFDTQVGKYPDLYEGLMNVKLLIRATQLMPVSTTAAASEE